MHRKIYLCRLKFTEGFPCLQSQMLNRRRHCLKHLLKDTSAVPDKPVVPEVNKTPGVAIMNKKDKFKDYWVIKPELREIIYIFLRSRLKKITSCQVHCPILPENVSYQWTTRWRIAGTHETMHDIQDSWIEPSEAHAMLKFPLIAIGPVKPFSCCHLSCRQVLIPKSF